MSVSPPLEVPAAESVDPASSRPPAEPDMAPQNTAVPPDSVKIPAELLAEAWWFV